MSNRVTNADVQEIRPNANLDYTAFITSANVIVDDVSTGCGGSFSDAKLAEIEKWLSAHLAGASDPKLTEEKFENASRKFERGNSGGGILSTQYGMMANTLSGGCLAQFDKQPGSIVFA